MPSMNPSPSDMKMLDELNAIRLTQKDVLRVVKRAAKEHVKGGDNTDLAICTSVIVFEKHPEKGKAVYFRLQALARLMKQDSLKGWTITGAEEDGTFANGAVFAAAAEQPLMLVDGDVSFERESFLKRVLELAESQGRG